MNMKAFSYINLDGVVAGNYSSVLPTTILQEYLTLTPLFRCAFFQVRIHLK